jgi:polyphosphate kinase
LKLLDYLQRKEILLHPPYHSYDTVLRFFNEAAIDVDVRRIYVTLYRVAKDSRIANAMIQAARNGKKVTVFVELKARFDEANNIKWAKRMKEAGVDIIYSIPELKVHAKLALIKRKKNDKTEYFGLLSTGNFNEGTARFYTDHILMTSNPNLLTEAEELFRFLKKRKKPSHTHLLTFQHLLVAQFNLQERFIALIDREIRNARKGLAASIVIKLNNLEEKVMIAKLYEASRAGVKISLIVRAICCLVPGVQGMSENIKVIRIVDRYLEHGRIFIFHNNGRSEIFMGSADWMDRNLHRRIEVCFPVYQRAMKEEIALMINLQLSDNAQAVQIDSKGNNIPVSGEPGQESLQSQSAINAMLTSDMKTKLAHEPIH